MQTLSRFFTKTTLLIAIASILMATVALLSVSFVQSDLTDSGTIQNASVNRADGTAELQQGTSPTAQAIPEHRAVEVGYRENTFVNLDRSGARSEKNEYYIAVTYTNEEPANEESATALAAGHKRLSVTTALGNMSGPAVTIEPQMLTLIDSDGTRYTALETENSEILDVHMEADQGVYGFLQFDVPTNFDTGTLEWCPDGAMPCQQRVQAPLP